MTPETGRGRRGAQGRRGARGLGVQAAQPLCVTSVHSLNKYLLSAYHAPRAWLGAAGTAGGQAASVPCPRGASPLVGKIWQTVKRMNKSTFTLLWLL